MILVLATMGEGKKRGKGKSALDNFEPHPATSIKMGEFISISLATINEETCAALCNEMPRCAKFTFRIEAEDDSLPGQCRFKTGRGKLMKEGENPNRNSYVKVVDEPELPPEEEEGSGSE